MGSIVLSTVLLVVTGWCGDRPLDKTGTGPSIPGQRNEKALEIQGFSEARSFDTEREGFEPTVGTGPTPVFKTGALNRSATSPGLHWNCTQQCWREKTRFERVDQVDLDQRLGDVSQQCYLVANSPFLGRRLSWPRTRFPTRGRFTAIFGNSRCLPSGLLPRSWRG